MKIYVQWATDPARGWYKYDSSQWRDLPKKLEPGPNHIPIFDNDDRVVGFEPGSEDIDDIMGWVSRVCVQGVSFFGDHIAVLHQPDEQSIDVYCWNDDLTDYDTEQLRGGVWKFHPLLTKPVANTRQYCTQFIHSSLLNSAPKMETTGGLVQYRNYDEFVLPDETLIRHGIWMTDALNNDLRAFAPMGWRRWL